jgi:hypothetical protein
VAQHVRADHDAALDLGPETLGAGAAVQVAQVVDRRRAVAELDAVEAAEVRARLRRRAGCA